MSGRREIEGGRTELLTVAETGAYGVNVTLALDGGGRDCAGEGEEGDGEGEAHGGLRWMRGG